MDRRTFIGRLAGGLLAAPLAAEAQPTGRQERGALKVLFANLNWGDTNASWNAQAIADRTRAFYQEASYGKVTLEPTVTPFVTLSAKRESVTSPSSFLHDAQSRLISLGFNPGAFARACYLTPRVAAVGYKGNCWGHGSWINCADSSYVQHGTIHELGHSFGLGHSGKIFDIGSRSGRVTTLFPLTTTTGGRTDSLYDHFTAMGYQDTQAHFNAPEKTQLGWIVPAVHTGGDRTYTLTPMERGGGELYAVKIPCSAFLGSSQRVYWLENRFRADLGGSGIQLRITGNFVSKDDAQAWYAGIGFGPGETITDGSVTIDVLDGGAIRVRPFVAAPPA